MALLDHRALEKPTFFGTDIGFKSPSSHFFRSVVSRVATLVGKREEKRLGSSASNFTSTRRDVVMNVSFVQKLRWRFGHGHMKGLQLKVQLIKPTSH